jgi:soluble lytic murein transglycosylase-like protein
LKKTVLFVLVILLLGETLAQAPLRAKKHRRYLVRQVHFIWGIDQPVDVFAAQIHAESRWQHLAESPYARGLGQQTPNTEEWLNELDSELALMGGGALDPKWSMRALVFYDRWLWKRVKGDGELNKWGFILHGYNAGFGWTRKEARASPEPLDYWCSVRNTCLRSQANCNQTRNYTQNIMFKYRDYYRDW